MSTYQVTHETAAYEQGTDGRFITAACVCGDGIHVLDKGVGRALAATWRTRHQDCTPTTDPNGESHG